MGVPSEGGGNLTLHLLDSFQGHPIQTWHFQNRTSVTIGRASENDISLTDTQVSRKHVELVYAEGTWLLRSHGRNGTLIDGSLVYELALGDRVVFQLGASGPSFQFSTVNIMESSMQTIDAIDPSILDFLNIDEERKAEDVRRIAESEEFRQLQEQALRMKQGDGNQNPGTDA